MKDWCNTTKDTAGYVRRQTQYVTVLKLRVTPKRREESGSFEAC